MPDAPTNESTKAGNEPSAAITVSGPTGPRTDGAPVGNRRADRRGFRHDGGKHPRATAVALVACLDDGRARPVAAGHPALPPAVIVELLADDDRQVACAAAANPALPPAEMTRLVH